MITSPVPVIGLFCCAPRVRGKAAAAPRPPTTERNDRRYIVSSVGPSWPPGPSALGLGHLSREPQSLRRFFARPLRARPFGIPPALMLLYAAKLVLSNLCRQLSMDILKEL